MTNIKVSSLKKQAKLKRKNNNSIKNHNDSLNIIAKENGYKNWQDLLNSAEIKVKSKLPNYVFLSKEELDAISTEELKKHESNIRKQYEDSLKEYQTIELIKLNEKVKSIPFFGTNRPFLKPNQTFARRHQYTGRITLQLLPFQAQTLYYDKTCLLVAVFKTHILI